MRVVKYIKTDLGCIVAFPEAMQHSDFKHLKPVSAGFLRLQINNALKGYESVYYIAFGRSESLGLVSDPLDGNRATNQLLQWL